jgi:hypothetical protein
MNILHKSALAYREKFDLSIFPVGQEKKPLIPWKEFQKRKAEPSEINDWYKRFPDANIGIVCGKINDLCVVDIDYQCGYEELAKYIPMDYPHPISTTPSGGQHWWFRLNGQKLRNNVAVIPGTDLRAEGGYIMAPPSHIAAGDYSWIAGKSIKNMAFPTITEAYSDAVVKLSSRCRQESSLSSFVVKMFSEGRRDHDLFHVALHLCKSNMPKEEVFEVIAVLAHHCGFPQDEATQKVYSALEHASKKERNISEEVREYVLSSNGVILSSDVVKCLQLSSRDDIKHVSKVMSRLTIENIIERYGNRNGQFRVVDNRIEPLNWRGAGAGEFEIKLPMEMHKYVKIQPKNIIIVAGASNSGKTAFLFNIVKDNIKNKEKKRIKYFSSEMSEQEFKGRIAGFGLPMEYWDFDPFERCGNFADVIDPDAINIIDFLEMHEDFWRVGALIKEIYDKLKTGIAIIALQKNSGSKLGRGGAMSIEKARLYIGMDFGKLWIEKGKNWRHETINPNGLTAEFKLAKGAEFLQVGNWHYEDEKGNPTCDVPFIERDVEDYFT